MGNPCRDAAEPAPAPCSSWDDANLVPGDLLLSWIHEQYSKMSGSGAASWASGGSGAATGSGVQHFPATPAGADQSRVARSGSASSGRDDANLRPYLVDFGALRLRRLLGEGSFAKVGVGWWAARQPGVLGSACLHLYLTGSALLLQLPAMRPSHILSIKRCCPLFARQVYLATMHETAVAVKILVSRSDVAAEQLSLSSPILDGLKKARWHAGTLSFRQMRVFTHPMPHSIRARRAPSSSEPVLALRERASMLAT